MFFGLTPRYNIPSPVEVRSRKAGTLQGETCTASIASMPGRFAAVRPEQAGSSGPRRPASAPRQRTPTQHQQGTFPDWSSHQVSGSHATVQGAWTPRASSALGGLETGICPKPRKAFEELPAKENSAEDISRINSDSGPFQLAGGGAPVAWSVSTASGLHELASRLAVREGAHPRLLIQAAADRVPSVPIDTPLDAESFKSRLYCLAVFAVPFDFFGLYKEVKQLSQSRGLWHGDPTLGLLAEGLELAWPQSLPAIDGEQGNPGATNASGSPVHWETLPAAATVSQNQVEQPVLLTLRPAEPSIASWATSRSAVTQPWQPAGLTQPGKAAQGPQEPLPVARHPRVDSYDDFEEEFEEEPTEARATREEAPVVALLPEAPEQPEQPKPPVSPVEALSSAQPASCLTPALPKKTETLRLNDSDYEDDAFEDTLPGPLKEEADGTSKQHLQRSDGNASTTTRASIAESKPCAGDQDDADAGFEEEVVESDGSGDFDPDVDHVSVYGEDYDYAEDNQMEAVT